MNSDCVRGPLTGGQIASGLGVYQQGRNALAGAPAPKLTSPVERVANTLEASERLAERVSALVDRIVGPVPVPVGSPVEHSGKGSAIDVLVSTAEDANSQIANANDALDRLARAFGL